mmetsp:Transcript_49404/g.105153  ORF Transcript_49404/g.105153 Transcript_49404/m.105153 type:complete len:913 (-) Transcript_49404:104-2842(-)
MSAQQNPTADSTGPDISVLVDADATSAPANEVNTISDLLPRGPAKPAAALPSLRFVGDELEQACKECAQDLQRKQTWDDKFLVVDTWLRFFDGEPIHPNRHQPVKSVQLGAAFAEGDDESVQEDATLSDPSDSAASAAAVVAATATDDAPQLKRKTIDLADVQVEIGRRFAKFKRVKEAFKLFEERYQEDVFSTIFQCILNSAASISKVQGALNSLAASTSGNTLHIDRSVARSLVANCFLLNVKGLPDLQKLYLSSANAAPHKILCLLVFFRSRENEDVGQVVFGIHKAALSKGQVNLPEEEPAEVEVQSLTGREDTIKGEKPNKDTPILIHEKRDAVEVEAPVHEATASGDAKPETEKERLRKDEQVSDQAAEQEAEQVALETVKAAADAEKAARASDLVGKGPRCGAAPPSAGGRFYADMTAALKDEAVQYSLILTLSGPGTFGRVADVKTPHEEVPLWEMPELMCFRPLFGLEALREDEFISVSGVHRVSRCCIRGPLLQVGNEAPPPAIVNILAFDLVRFVDDRRYSLATLQHDIRKWAAVYAGTDSVSSSDVVIPHPPLLGVEKHAAFALHLAACGIAWSGLGDEDVPKVRYVLSDDGYATGPDPAPELSASQTKEAKHFEALAGRMKSSDWSSSEVLALLALYPFARSSESERFHAFWTRRLRSGGKPSGDELVGLARRQNQLTPLDPPPREPTPPRRLPPARTMPSPTTTRTPATTATTSASPVGTPFAGPDAGIAAAPATTASASIAAAAGAAATRLPGPHPGLSMALPDAKPRPRGYSHGGSHGAASTHHSNIVGQRQHTALPVMPRPGPNHQHGQQHVHHNTPQWTPQSTRVVGGGGQHNSSRVSNNAYVGGHRHGHGHATSTRDRSRSRGRKSSHQQDYLRGERSRKRSQSRERARRRHH